MKIVIPGGQGIVGRSLVRAFQSSGDEVVVLSRSRAAGVIPWDGVTLGPWASAIDGADVVINLAGRSVNCRYNKANLTEMFASRVDSTRVVGEAIAAAARPPRVWLQMSTATVYAHRFDSPNDEATGMIGGHESDAPSHWRFSIEIAKAWERAQADAATPHTRRVALRSALVMSAEAGGVFDLLMGLTRLGLGGAVAGGPQRVSWIHVEDFVRAVRFLVAREDFSGPVNLAAPEPLPQRDFMAQLRAAAGIGIGLPATAWMIEMAAALMRSESELLLKSRYVVPGRLLADGFAFDFPSWSAAATDLIAKWRAAQA